MILITGSTGLVGRHLLLTLIQKNQQVRALYRSENNKREVERFFAFAKAESFTTFIDWQQGDITDLPRLEQVFQNITQVYHCAAFISFDPYQFKKLTKINVEGTANVVNLCLHHSIEKLVHLSSIATLAKTPQKPIDENNYWDPDAQVSVYALTKYGAEMEVWRGTEEGLNAVILNPGIILGEGNYDTGSGVLFKRAWKGAKFYPKGTTGIIDVKDLVILMVDAMNSSISQERFIAVSENMSYEHLTKSIAQSLGRTTPNMSLQTWILHVFVILDALKGIISRNRILTKVGATSLQQEHIYTSKKAVAQFNFEPRKLSQTLERISQHFKLYRA